MAFALNYTHTIADATLSNILSNIINHFEDFYDQEVDFSGLGFLDPNNTDINTISNYLSAVVTLTQWWAVNMAGNYTTPGSTQSNPYAVPLNETQKCQIIQSLGGFADDKIYGAYKNYTVFNPAMGNTYYSLNTDRNYGGIKWENDELVIYDRYNFEGIGDFGSAPDMADYEGKPFHFIAGALKAMAVCVAFAPMGTGIAVVRQFMRTYGFNPDSGTFYDGQSVGEIDDTIPFTVFRKEDRDKAIGNVRNLYIENRFTKEQICQCNPDLYRDAVNKGKMLGDQAAAVGVCSNIQSESQCFDAIDNVVEVGAAQPSPLLGIPYYAPRVMGIGTNPTAWQVGTNDKYPSPFTSFQQQINNNTAYLGPYAMWGSIAGRICLIVGGDHSGERGFIAQCWDNFEDGPNNVDNDGIQYSDKWNWWINTRKIDVSVPNLLFSGRPNSIVKVAVESFDGPGSNNVWGPNWPISTVPDGSVNLSHLIGLAVLTSRYF